MAEEEILTTKEAAEFLKLSICTLYKLQREKQIPFKKIGAQVRYCKSDLIAWIKNGDAVNA